MNTDLDTLLDTLLRAQALADAPAAGDPAFVARVMRRVRAMPMDTLAPEAALQALRAGPPRHSPGVWAAALAIGATLAASGWWWAGPSAAPGGALSLVWAGAAALVAWALLAPAHAADF
jgi:hypothetical protein